MVLYDWWFTVQQIAKFIGISSGSVHTVLTEILEMSKLSAGCIPRRLTPKPKLKRVNISKTLLTCFQVNHKISTADSTRWNLGSPLQTWINDSKQTMETFWFSTSEASGVKVMAFVFLRYNHDTLPEKGKTINGQYYESELK